MDIANPSKAIWLVYCTLSDGRGDEHSSDMTKLSLSNRWPSRFPGMLDKTCDLIRLAPEISKAIPPIESRVKTDMKKNTYFAIPRFQVPNFDALRKAH